MAANLRSARRRDKARARGSSIELPHAATSPDVAQEAMARLWSRGGLAVILLVLAEGALAAPKLERERCTFKPPRGDRVECFVLSVLENREQPEGREVRIKVAVLK